MRGLPCPKKMKRLQELTVKHLVQDDTPTQCMTEHGMRVRRCVILNLKMFEKMISAKTLFGHCSSISIIRREKAISGWDC